MLKVLSKSSREVSAMVGYLESPTPAELTRMWGGQLKACSAESKRDFTWVGSETSAWKMTARGEEGEEEALISAATSSAWALLEV